MAKFPTMTRDEARNFITWAKSNPEAMKAYMDGNHPGHREAVQMAQHAFYWLHDHPQDKHGNPRVWDVSAPGSEKPNVFADMRPDTARATIENVKKNPALVKILTDGKHPDHAQAVEEWTALFERAHSEPIADPNQAVAESIKEGLTHEPRED